MWLRERETLATDLDRVRAQVQKWRDDLVSLNRRNRLLYFKHTKTSSLQISSPTCDELLSVLSSRPGRLEFYQRVLYRDQLFDEPTPLRPPAKYEAISQVWRGSAADGELRDATGAELAKVLRNLDRQTRAEFMDRGLQSLYLGLGLLEWIDPRMPDEVNSAPLLLVPVELERSGPSEPYRLVRAQDDVVVNPALQLKLDNDFGMTLPAWEDDDGGCEEYFVRIRRAIRPQPEWNISEVSVLARFSFLKEVMYRDLLEHEDEICEHPLVQALAAPVGSRSDFDFEPISDRDIDDVAVDTTLLSIRDADATQRACIWAAREGRTFVMDGPPGTGKSQTIANMIAELIGNGRTVLFVSEKAAALEVVSSRLQECGLDEYVLQLHSHKATRRAVAQQLNSSVSKRPRMDGQLTETEIANLHRTRARLTEYATAMNEIREPLGMSLFSVLGRAAVLSDLARPAVRAELDASLTASQLATILAAADDLQRAWGPVERGQEFVWRDLTIARLDTARRAEIGGLLQEALSANANVSDLLSAAAEALRGWDSGEGAVGLTAVGELLTAVSDAPDVDPLWLTHASHDELVQALEKLIDMQSKYEEHLAEVRVTIGPAVDKSYVLELAAEYSAAKALSDQASGWAPGGDWTTARVSDATTMCGDLMATIQDEIDGPIRDIVSAIGLTGWEVVGLSEVRDLVELLGIAELAERPEAEWLSPMRLSELKNAQTLLASLVTATRQKREQLAPVFKPNYMDLDAEALFQRFSQVHVGLRRVNLGYLKDRKTLAEACHTGKFTTSAVQLLPIVVELQGLSSRLETFERDDSRVIGSYYRGEETDLERLDRAIKLAESALAMVERRMSLSRALSRIALGAEMDSDAMLRARRLRAILDGVMQNLAAVGSDVQTASKIPLEELLAHLKRVGDAAAGWAAFGRRFEPDCTVSAMTECAASAEGASSCLAEEEIARPRFTALIGESYQGLETETVSLRRRVESTARIRDALGASVPSAVARRVLDCDLDASQVLSVVGDWNAAEAKALEHFSEERADELRQQMDGYCGDADRLLRLMGATLDDIDEWIAFSNSRRRLGGLGLEALVDACINQGLPQQDVVGVIERVVLETWVDTILEEDAPRLSPLRAKDRHALRAEFNTLDTRLVRSAAGRVMESCNKRRPSKNVGAVGIILREGQKKTRHMPIRTLLEKTKADAQAIKPCFMMSPLSVSQFLPSDMRFDVVLFDEASQIRPHDAINCIYRGKQHVIAGDQQQLPPTSFFDGVRDDGDDVWDEDDLESFESVLDVAKSCASVPSLPLRWHYRSRHEDLITYSNVSFYDSGLISFPAPHLSAPVLGIGFNKVDGVYRRGRGSSNDNPIEAQAVAELVARYAKEHPKLTLGVVAFSSSQEEAIENAIEQLRTADPTLPDGYFDTERLNGFFVKNLETVQGDERDVIILSIGYGRDETGKILMNFGPINQAGGYRRLNVAVTRARMRLELVTSITSADISASSENDGVRHMRRYLEYAERGPEALLVGDGRSLGGTESSFEAEVARVIRSWGYDVVTQVGSAGYRIDLALVHPDQPGRLCLAIECDGATYHSSKVARDRDRLRDEVLRGLGWQIHRIWSTAWYRQRDFAESELRAAIEHAVDRPGTPLHMGVVRDLDAERPAVQMDEQQVGEDFSADDWVTDYVLGPPNLTRHDTLIPMGDRSACPIMQRHLPHIVAIESPVHWEVALRRLREAWGQQRAGKNARAEFETALRHCVRTGAIESDEAGFLWRPGDKSVTKARRPVPGIRGTERSCHEVSDEEFDVAVRSVLESVTSIGETQLVRQVAAVFGWERVGSDISHYILGSIGRVVKSDALLEDRILADEDLPKASPGNGRPASPLTPETPSSPSSHPESGKVLCAVCGMRFGPGSAPSELQFVEVDGPETRPAHLSCAEAVIVGRKRMDGYRWDAHRRGLVSLDVVINPRHKPEVVEEPVAQPQVIGWDKDSNTPIIGYPEGE